MNEKTINIAQDFSRAPGGRYRAHGPHSGEEFRDDFIVPALKSADRVIITLDGAAGYAGSFLEEAFGGLVRVSKLPYEELQRRLEVKAIDSRYAVYVRMANQYLKDAKSASIRVA
jgi:hypothetical protein